MSPANISFGVIGSAHDRLGPRSVARPPLLLVGPGDVRSVEDLVDLAGVVRSPGLSGAAMGSSYMMIGEDRTRRARRSPSRTGNVCRSWMPSRRPPRPAGPAATKRPSARSAGGGWRSGTARRPARPTSTGWSVTASRCPPATVAQDSAQVVRDDSRRRADSGRRVRTTCPSTAGPNGCGVLATGNGDQLGVLPPAQIVQLHATSSSAGRPRRRSDRAAVHVFSSSTSMNSPSAPRRRTNRC